MKRTHGSTLYVSLGLTAMLVLAPFSSFAEEAARNPSPANLNGLILNFRGVPLDTVLDYLSREAGFAIVKEADVSGSVDVWSHQPLSRDEAVDLLNTVLHEKGFAAVRNGRTLTIVTRENAKQRDIRVQTGNNPEQIPKTDEMITQIIPVRYTNATQLIENLQPLIPSYATLSANESSNAIVLTDTQKNIRRMAEIIRALDTSISSISAVRVFPLQYADAKELATIVESIFKTEDTTQGRNASRFPMPPFMGRGGDRGGDRGSGQNQNESEARAAASRVVAVADERTNSLVVSAPEELMSLIERLVREVDTASEDITEIWVFTLQYADATETAQLITELFPDSSSSSTQQFAPRFGRGGMMGGPPMMGNAQQSSTASSERQLQQTTVRAVADPRTNSVVVTAASETMAQIKQMIQQLDSRSDKKQKVYVYKLEYADVENVAEILRNIFENQTYGSTNRSSTRSQNTNTNTLSNRTVPSSNTGTGSSQFGGSRGN